LAIELLFKIYSAVRIPTTVKNVALNIKNTCKFTLTKSTWR